MLSALLVLAAAASPAAAPRAPASLPLCADASDDALLLSDEESLSPSEIACAYTPPPPVVDCNDARSSVWVQEMIGSCAMPRTAPSTMLASAPRRERNAPTCSGRECRRDPLPLRGVDRTGDGTPPLLVGRPALPPPPGGARLVPVPPQRLASIDPRRIERPPRA